MKSGARSSASVSGRFDRPRGAFTGARTTLGIALALALVFGLEYRWGGPTVPLLARMGALAHADVWESRWYRLFAATFLHTGVLHFALNVAVLLVAGRAVERALGAHRLLVVYFVSALAGSLGASWLTPGSSVGASGAVFGVVVSELVLSFRTPSAEAPPAVERRGALVNVAILSIASLNPGVDVAAHLGGAAAGGVLAFLFRGLAALEPSPARANAWGLGTAPAHAAIRTLGVGLTSLALASSLTAIVCHQPWRLAAAPSWSEQDLADLGVRVELPGELAPPAPRAAGGATAEVALGRLARDPAIVALTLLRLPATYDAIGELERARQAFAMAPEPGVVLTSVPRIRAVAGRSLAAAEYALPPGLVLERAAVVSGGALFRVETAYYEEYRKAWAGSAARIALSVRQLP